MSIALGGTVAAMTLFAALSAPMAQAATPAPTSSAVTLAAVATPLLADEHEHEHGDHRGDRRRGECWRWWGGHSHNICRGGGWWYPRNEWWWHARGEHEGWHPRGEHWPHFDGGPVYYGEYHHNH